MVVPGLLDSRLEFWDDSIKATRRWSRWSFTGAFQHHTQSIWSDFESRWIAWRMAGFIWIRSWPRALGRGWCSTGQRCFRSGGSRDQQGNWGAGCHQTDFSQPQFSSGHCQEWSGGRKHIGWTPQYRANESAFSGTAKRRRKVPGSGFGVSFGLGRWFAAVDQQATWQFLQCRL